MSFFYSASDRLRLEADVHSYLQELRFRFPDIHNKTQVIYDQLKAAGKKKLREKMGETDTVGRDKPAEIIIATLLAKSLYEIEHKKIETGWRFLNKAQTMEIVAIDDKKELINVGKKIYDEAGKVSSRRKKPF